MEDFEDMESSNTISNNWKPNDYDIRSMYSAPAASQQEYSSQEVCTQRDPPLSQMADMENVMDIQKTEAPPPPKPWARLVCKTSELPSYELFPIAPDAENRHNLYMVGRSSQCSLRIESSARISNRHCLIYCRENLADKQNPYLEAWVEDLSANGKHICVLYIYKLYEQPSMFLWLPIHRPIHIPIHIVHTHTHTKITPIFTSQALI
ncbi:FHA domain-containing protein [archaeon]|nr:MAG: FHA domain-containing protein [archaeon]